MTILLDIESRSRIDLKKVGSRNYWNHASTEAICCAWERVETGAQGLWFMGDPAPPWAGTDEILAAHNMTGFDRFGCYRLGWSTPDQPWIDTSELCRVQGWPASLEELGVRYGVPKDLAASRFTTSLSTCRRPSGKRNPDAIPAADWSLMSDEDKRYFGVQKELTPDVLALVGVYCEGDREIMSVAWPDLEPWLGLEPKVEHVSRIVNDRGVAFDRDLARALLEADARNAERELSAIAREIGASVEEVRAVASSPAQFTEQTGAPNAQAETIDEMIAAGPDGPYGEAGYLLAKARRALASIASGKLRAGLAHCSPDGRLRDSLLYYGGHTGRYSGKGMQLHNLPRPDKKYEDLWDDKTFWGRRKLDESERTAWVNDMAEGVLAGVFDPDQDDIDLLVRATLWAPPGTELIVRDFKGVEARALAWVAGDEKALDVFRAEGDPYRVMATHVFNCTLDAVEKWQRQIGKNAELGCGYGMGARKFKDYCLKAGTDLDKLGINPQDVINAWRELHAPIKRFWRDVEDALLAAVDGHESSVAGFDFRCSSDGRDVAVFLPSGRPLVYPNVRVHVKDTDYGPKPSLCYDEVKNGSIVEGWLYGGKITENLIQAMCRCLLTDALVRVEAAGLNPVLHVHDEIVCEVPGAYADEALEYLHEIMTTLPDWARGFPIGASGFQGKRYRK